MTLATELQTLANEIKAKRDSALRHDYPRRPVAPAPSNYRPSTAYRSCSLCGDKDHSDGACYGGEGL